MPDDPDNQDLSDIPELTDDFSEHAIKASVRKRLMRGEIESGDDIVALRKFLRMTQQQFAAALSINVNTLQNWEQGRRYPEGPAIALLRIAARYPRIIRSLASSAA